MGTNEETRKRMKRCEEPGTARFLTFSCFHRLPLFQNDRIKDEFVADLTRVSDEQHVEIIAWVVMPEHVHLIVYSESTAIDRYLYLLKREFAVKVLRRWRALEAPILSRLRTSRGVFGFWQPGGGYDRNVIGEELLEKTRYVHHNPVKRSLVDMTTEWKWSSAQGYAADERYSGPPLAVELLPRVAGRLF